MWAAVGGHPYSRDTHLPGEERSGRFFLFAAAVRALHGLRKGRVIGRLRFRHDLGQNLADLFASLRERPHTFEDVRVHIVGSLDFEVNQSAETADLDELVTSVVLVDLIAYQLIWRDRRCFFSAEEKYLLLIPLHSHLLSGNEKHSRRYRCTALDSSEVIPHSFDRQIVGQHAGNVEEHVAEFSANHFHESEAAIIVVVDDFADVALADFDRLPFMRLRTGLLRRLRQLHADTFGRASLDGVGHGTYLSLL